MTDEERKYIVYDPTAHELGPYADPRSIAACPWLCYGGWVDTSDDIIDILSRGLLTKKEAEYVCEDTFYSILTLEEAIDIINMETL